MRCLRESLKRKGAIMFIAGVLLYGVVVSLVSYFVSRSGNIDRGAVATSTTLVAWGSMIAGLLLSKAMH